MTDKSKSSMVELVMTILDDRLSSREAIEATFTRAEAHLEAHDSPEHRRWRDRLKDVPSSDLAVCRFKAVLMPSAKKLDWVVDGKAVKIPVSALDFTLASRARDFAQKQRERLYGKSDQ